MEQGKARQSILPSFFTKEELEVCDILLDLENLINQSIPKPFPEIPNWEIRRKRTKKDGSRSSSSSPLKSHHSPEIKLKVVDKVKKALSPATPLSFSTNESDETPKHSSKKRGRKELMGSIQQLTATGEILKGEVERVRNYYNQLQAENIELKEKKRKMLLKKEEEIKNMNSRNNGFSNFGQHFGISPHPQQCFLISKYQHHQDGQLFPSSASTKSSSSLRQPIGPRGIPDLNISAEESFGLDNFQPLDPGTIIITCEGPKEKRLIRRIIMTKKRIEHRLK